MKKLLIPLAATWLCCTGATAPAAVPDQHSTTVATADLDLASVSGKAALQRRIDFAVRRVCDEPGMTTTEGYEQRQACEADARRQTGLQLSRMALVISPEAGMTVQIAFASPEHPDWP